MNFLVFSGLCLLGLAMGETTSSSNFNVSTTLLDFRNRNAHVRLGITFEAFTPKGLRITIGNITGIDLIAFHGNINLPIGYRDTGNLSIDLIHPSDNYIIKKFTEHQLLFGDVINYWVRIQYKGLSLYLEKQSTIIKELSPAPFGWSEFESSNGTATTPRPSIYPQRTTTPRSRGEQAHRKTEIRTTTTVRPPAMLPDYGAYENAGATNANNESEQPQCVCNESMLQDLWSQLNATVGKVSSLEENLTPLQNKVDSLMETIDELTKNINIGTKLRLVGNLPMHSNPAEDVRYLLIEKLKLDDLSNNILQAEYKGNGVSFEMSSSIDKLRILKRSKDILAKLPYQIIDPDNPKIDIRSSE